MQMRSRSLALITNEPINNLYEVFRSYFITSIGEVGLFCCCFLFCFWCFVCGGFFLGGGEGESPCEDQTLFNKKSSHCLCIYKRFTTDIEIQVLSLEYT